MHGDSPRKDVLIYIRYIRIKNNSEVIMCLYISYFFSWADKIRVFFFSDKISVNFWQRVFSKSRFQGYVDHVLSRLGCFFRPWLRCFVTTRDHELVPLLYTLYLRVGYFISNGYSLLSSKNVTWFFFWNIVSNDKVCVSLVIRIYITSQQIKLPNKLWIGKAQLLTIYD